MYDYETMELMTEATDSIPTVEGTEYSDYIKNNMLNSFLNEDYNSITECITKLRLADAVDESMVMEAMVNIQTSSCGSITKLDAMREVVDIFAESVKKDYVNEDAVMLEFAGNPEKNKALKKLMVEMEKVLEQYYRDIDTTVSTLDEMAAIVKKEAKKGDKCNAKSAAIAAKGVFERAEKMVTSKEYKESDKKYNDTYTALKRVCKSFSIKFSDIAMEDKKVFDKKLDAACKKLTTNKKITNWLPNSDTGITQAIKDLNSDLDVLHIDNSDAVKAIINYIQPIYNYAYSCIMGYIGNINYIRKILGLEREDTIFYKILNKVIKTKKD